MIVIWCTACVPLYSASSPTKTTTYATLPVPGPTPTITVFGNRTSTPTSSPEPELSVTDYWLHVTQTVGQLLADTTPRIDQSYVSPDKQWRVDVAVRDCTKADPRPGADENALEQLVLVSLQSASQEIVSEQFLYCGGVGAYGFGGLLWSADSRFFYFTPAKNGGPDGVCWYWERPINFLDTQSQEAKILGGGPDSPDGSRVAVWQEDELVIWDYNLGEALRIGALVEGAQVGPKAWAPDSTRLVYIQRAADCVTSGESTLVMVDVATGMQKELLRSTNPSVAYVDWVEPDLLRLRNLEGEAWRFVLSTGQMTAEP